MGNDAPRPSRYAREAELLALKEAVEHLADEVRSHRERLEREGRIAEILATADAPLTPPRKRRPLPPYLRVVKVAAVPVAVGAAVRWAAACVVTGRRARTVAAATAAALLGTGVWQVMPDTSAPVSPAQAGMAHRHVHHRDRDRDPLPVVVVPARRRRRNAASHNESPSLPPTRAPSPVPSVSPDPDPSPDPSPTPTPSPLPSPTPTPDGHGHHHHHCPVILLCGDQALP